MLHDHRRPRPHFDLRLEEDGVLRSWAMSKGLPNDPRHDRLAIAVDDHDLDHADFEDEHKSIADAGTWEEHDRTERRLLPDEGPSADREGQEVPVPDAVP